LQYQLFNASKSKRIKAQRRSTWLFSTFVILIIALLSFFNDHEQLGYSFIVAAIVFFCFFQKYNSYYYRRHYQKFVQDLPKSNFDQTVTVVFNPQTIETFDKSAELKINLSEFEEFNEIGHYIYLKTQAGTSLIVPKLKLENQEIVISELKALADRLHINYTTELNWKWK